MSSSLSSSLAFAECRDDCRREKQNHCITSALFCQHDLFCHLKIVEIFSNIYALLFIFSKLQTTEKAQSSLSIVTVCDVFFQKILDPISLESI